MSKDKVVPAINAADKAILDYIASLQMAPSGGPTSTSTTSTASAVTKLTTASARALMNEAKASVGYTGGFTNDEVQAFIKDFNENQDKQIQRVVTIAKSKATPGATPEATRNLIESTFREEYPSFFKPAEFASDYVWGKVNFGQESTLSGKNLGVLSQVRGVVKDFQILGYSDAEALAAAKDIARGKYTVADFTTKVQQLAVIEYPQFAERFKTDPTLTVKKIAQPIINMLADTWEVDAGSIDLKDPIVRAWLHPGGSDGKQPPISYNEAYQRALKHPKSELTKRANDSARDAGVGLASAFGFGI